MRCLLSIPVTPRTSSNGIATFTHLPSKYLWIYAYRYVFHIHCIYANTGTCTLTLQNISVESEQPMRESFRAWVQSISVSIFTPIDVASSFACGAPMFGEIITIIVLMK